MNPSPTTQNGQIIYNTAKGCLDQGIAPTNLAELGCAITVWSILQKAALPLQVSDNESTYWLWQALVNSPDWVKIDAPEAGCIIISPTGTQPKNSPLTHGHTGIVLLYGIGSNDSFTGTFRENFTIDGWNAHFAQFGKFPVYYFRRK